MGISSLFQRYPLLLPLISLGLGIVGGKKIFFSEWMLSSVSTFLLCLIFLLLMFITYSIQRYVMRWIYGVFLTLFFASLGITLTLLSLEKTQSHFFTNTSCYKVRLVSNVSNHPNSYIADAQLISRVDSLGFNIEEKCFIQLYFEKDSLLSELKCDDELLIYSKIQSPQIQLNDEAFDYSCYLLYNGYAGTGYVSKGRWKKLISPSKHTIKYWSLYCQEQVVELYKKWNLNEDALGVLSALTVGVKSNIEEEVLTSFSSAGVNHVLALSGLHVGFICLFFHFFLRWMSRKNRTIEKWGRVPLVVVLWLFSFLVGSSPSIVRAVMMFSLFLLSSLGNRKRSSIQVLCVTALVMLLYRPLWLFDVGFQLSFVAVASILIIHPIVKNYFSFHFKISNYVWELISVSLVAQLGVLPLIIYYFSTFPLYFLLGNLLVIPLISVILFIAFLALLTFFMPVVNSILVFLLSQLLILLLSLVKSIESLPYSTLDGIWITEIEVFVLLILLVFFTLLLYKPSVRHLTLFLCGVGLFLMSHFYYQEQAQLKSDILFYSVRNCPVIHCVENNKESYLALIKENSWTKRLFKNKKRFWNHYHLQPNVISNLEHQSNLFYSKPLLVFHNFKIAILDDSFCVNKTTINPYKVNLIYLCQGFKGNLSSVLRVFSSSEVILDASLPYYLQKQMKSECETMGIHCIALFRKGSYGITI